MKIVGFKCSHCGECCNTVPALTFPEIFIFQHDFVIIFHLITKVYNLKSENNKNRNFNINTEFYFKLNDNYGIELICGFEPLDYKEENRCLMLDANNLCKLHLENRIPLRCSSVPFAPYLMNKKTFPNMMQKKLKLRPYFKNCIYFKYDDKQDMEILWKSEKFNKKSSLIKALHKENEQYNKDSKNIYSIIYDIFKVNGFKDFHNLLDINNIIRNCNFTSNIDFLYFENFMPLHFIFNNTKVNNIKFYQMLEQEYLIDCNDILELYQNQINVINKVMQQNMNDKFKQNLKLILNVYNKKLHSKVQ